MRQFYGHLEKSVLSAGKTMSVKFPFLGGVFGGGGGGECRFYFYGRADFSEKGSGSGSGPRFLFLGGPKGSGSGSGPQGRGGGFGFGFGFVVFFLGGGRGGSGSGSARVPYAAWSLCEHWSGAFHHSCWKSFRNPCPRGDNSRWQFLRSSKKAPAQMALLNLLGFRLNFQNFTRILLDFR